MLTMKVDLAKQTSKPFFFFFLNTNCNFNHTINHRLCGGYLFRWVKCQNSSVMDL